MSSGGKKKIFISDIHIGDARGMTGNYGWFQENIPILEQFLAEMVKSTEVEEVVILGDLFDRWVVPAEQEPIISFKEIINNPKLKNIMEALQELAKRRMLTYLPGNHDMSFSPGDHAQTKQIMEIILPNMTYLTDAARPHGVYHLSTMVGEHGNQYGLFNSPDTWDDPASFIPLGYFITRLIATIAVVTGVKSDHGEILKKYVYKWIYQPNFIENLFYDLAGQAGLKKDFRFNMTGIAGFPDPTVNGIVNYYKDLLEKWPPAEHGQLYWPTAVVGDMGYLYPAASMVYFFHPGSQKNIVIFGHTHKADLIKSLNLKEADRIEDIYRAVPSLAIYANCGTWIDSAPCTYVETREDAIEERYYVRLKKYPGDKILQEGFVCGGI